MKALINKRNRNYDEINKSTNNITKKKSDLPNFLVKLYQILESNEHSSLIEWGDNGKFFIVKNLSEFTERVLPQYFKHNNFSSFVRQVIKNNI